MSARRAPAQIKWRTDTKAAEREAAKLERPLLVFFSAEWCMPCLEMKRKSFADPRRALRSSRAASSARRRHDERRRRRARRVSDRFHVSALPTLLRALRAAAEKLRLDRFVARRAAPATPPSRESADSKPSSQHGLDTTL